MSTPSLLKKLLSAPVIVALVIMTLAIGGSAYAAGKITGKQIAKNTVTSKNIKNGTIKTKDIAEATLAEIQATADAKSKGYAVRRTNGAAAQPADSTIAVKKLNLPAGMFTLTSRVVLDDISGAPKIVRCELVQGAAVIDTAQQTLPGSVGAFSCVNMGVVTLAAPGTVTLQVKTPAASVVRFAEDATILATQVASAASTSSPGAD